MRRANLSDPQRYLACLEAQPELLDDLAGEITVGETYFFRDPQQCAVIRDEVLPVLLSHRPRDRALRIWSAGCATGEEAYTLAILLREIGAMDTARIVATDLSRTALAAARRGGYGRWSFRGVPEQVIRTYFQPAGDRFEPVPTVREAVDFRYLNLAEDVYPSLPTGIWGMDLILCRNVLIYFDAGMVARVARRLIDSLSDDGWLLLGASDPALGDLLPCDVVVTPAGLAYRRPGRAILRPRPADSLTPAFAPPPVPQVLAPKPPPVPPAPPAREPAVPVQTSEGSEGPSEAARLYGERDYGRAAELAGRLVQGDGSDPALWIVLVRALANRGELKAAGQACAAALDSHRTSAELTYLHAVLLAEAGHPAEAADAARGALYLDRGLIVAHLALGGVLARLGDADGARRALRNAQRLLAGMEPARMVPASDGENAGRLAEMARLQLQLLSGAAA
jgi:chemotaxis protein methyltransferase CheR